MKDPILKAARDLGIEASVRVLEDHQLTPLVTVIVGERRVQSRISPVWLFDSTGTHIRQILSDMHRAVAN